MKIRKAKKEDAGRISRLIRNTINKINSKHYPKKQLKSELACYTSLKIKEYISDKNRLVFCFVDNSKLIGASILDVKLKILESIYLNPRYIGKGFGKQLLELMEDKARKLKITTLILYPTDYAYKFYKKMGYKKIREFIGTKNGGFPVIEMKKKLR